MLANGYTRGIRPQPLPADRRLRVVWLPRIPRRVVRPAGLCLRWIKCHHPAIFLAALLNSQPMGFYGPAQLVADARAHGVEVRPVDVNHSDWETTIERRDEDGSLAVRLGLSMIKGLSGVAGETVVRARRDGPFRSYGDFVARTRLTTAILSRLAAADAFGSLGLGRRPALWQSLADDAGSPAVRQPRRRTAPTVAAAFTTGGRLPRLPFPGPVAAGPPPRRPARSLAALNVVPAARLKELEADRRYQVAGLVLMRQRPSTAKGTTFMTLEDETGIANLIIWPQVWERFRRIGRQARAVIATGHVAAAGRRHPPDRHPAAGSHGRIARSRPSLADFH